ncbi:iron chaperone [Pedobacter nutrimenti]|jgi:uncharacterized protein YdhG (YjbR/CyaY superfamily)|uniref:Uncharacterized protein YdhG (YjbR/CyaY superfamily) n=1 Tax=Pedobacter nutrimenti TaxID=1241337 RepID=A0A318UBB2_9SPHI|nr:DUF1801 domain-containing protein [Pedobacter nutrimenti]PYF72823.1 uncharacterized protein YdhG (YjbR/CyaY superfamily) [Pedobacter nutrimenti]|eukprot:gene14641-17316_t
MNSVDQYIQSFPGPIQLILTQVRETIKKNAPQAEESISYAMPAYKLKTRPLIYFAAFKKHIGLYATPSAHRAFSDALSNYKKGKGSVQFPIDQPMPLDLIADMVRFKVKENSGS